MCPRIIKQLVLVFLLMISSFGLLATPVISVQNNHYPTWQIVAAGIADCYPSGAYIEITRLSPGVNYIYRARFLDATNEDIYGQIYHFDNGQFVDWDEEEDLPGFTALTADTAFTVIYRATPDMVSQLGHWNLEFSIKEANSDTFATMIALPDTIGMADAGAGEFAMGFLQYDSNVSKQHNATTSGDRAFRKVLAVEGSPVRALYLPEPNGINEGFPNIEGYYRLPYPVGLHDTLQFNSKTEENDTLGTALEAAISVSPGQAIWFNDQIFTYVDKSNHPHWQYVHPDSLEKCYPAAAYLELSGLRAGTEYAFRSHFHYNQGNSWYGYIYNPNLGQFVHWSDTLNLPTFTASGSEEAFWVIYKTEPGMATDAPNNGKWWLTISASPKAKIDFPLVKNLRVTVGNENDEKNKMGFVTYQNRSGKGLNGWAGGENKVIVVYSKNKKKKPSAIYISENNNINEGYPEDQPGYYFVPYPAGNYQELTFETRERPTNQEIGSTTVDDVEVTAGGMIIGDQPLPVSLMNFSAFALNSAVRLHWATGSEENNAGFEIARAYSQNGIFLPIASYHTHPALLGAGTTNIRHDYQFIDENLINGTTYYYQLTDIDFNGVRNILQVVSATPNEVADTSTAPIIIKHHDLAPNYPNPFNPETTIRYTISGDITRQLSGAVNVSLNIYNMLGKKVKTLVTAPHFPGQYKAVWDAKDDNGQAVGSGVYVYLLKIGHQTQLSRKMLLLR